MHRLKGPRVTLGRCAVMRAPVESGKSGEAGFSLIELLVVVIIIGILAAIAIPTYLGQREKAQSAAVQSDLRNAATAATLCFADKDGSYEGCNIEKLRTSYDFHSTDGVTVEDGEMDADHWAASAYFEDNEAGTRYHFDTEEAQVEPGGP